ncbi:MAG: MFS transporter [Promethearchaeota archaeon]
MKKNYKRKEKGEFRYKDYRKNVRLFQITGIDITTLALPGIILVWFETRLEFHEILILQGLFVLTTILFEIPSGVLADSWTRKGSAELYHILYSLGLFFYTIGTNFTTFVIAEICRGIGEAFQTGSETALIYDSILTQHKESVDRSFGKIMSQRMTLLFIGAAICSILGGILGEIIYIRMPIALTVIGHLFFGILTLGYIEPPKLRSITPKIVTVKAISSLRKNISLQAIMLFSIVSLVFGRIGFWAGQHILVEDFKISTLALGFVLAGLNTTAATASFLIRRHVDYFARFSILLCMLLADVVYFLVLLKESLSLIVFLVAAIITQITRGAMTPIVQSLVQHQLSSEERVTFASLISFVGSVVFFLASMSIELLSLSRNDSLMLSLLGTIVIIGLFSFLVLSR